MRQVHKLEELDLDETNPINLDNYIASLSSRYDSKPDGAQNETIQNALDEFDRNDDKDKLLIQLYFDPELGIFEARDNAGGMSLDTLKKQYTTFEQGDKDQNTRTRGSEGQGGAVLLALGDYIEIETMRDGDRSSARWTPTNRGFNYGFQQLDEDGTIVRVVNVEDEYKEDLKNFSHMKRLIQRYWQEALKRDDVTVTYEVEGFIEESEIEPVEMDEDKIEKTVEKENIKVMETNSDDLPDDVQEKGYIEIDSFKLFVFEEKRPEAFPDTLAMNVYGQTIEWRQPQRVNSKHKVVAFAEVPDIRSLDFPNHRNFKDKKAVKEVKKKLSQMVRNATEELRDNTETTEAQEEGIKEAVRQLNEKTEGTVFEQLYGDFDPDGNEEQDEEGEEGQVDSEPDHPYPSSCSIQERGENPDFGDNLNADISVRNPKGVGYDVETTVEFLYPRSKTDEVEDELIDAVRKDNYVKGNREKRVGTIEFKIPENQEIEGRYRIRIKSKTRYKKNVAEEQSTYYIEIGEDVSISNPGQKTSGPQRLDDISLGRADGDWKAKFNVTEDGEHRIWINATHPAFDKEVVSRRSQEDILDYCFQCGITAFVDRLTGQKIDEHEQSEDFNDLRDELDEIFLDRDKMEKSYAEDFAEGQVKFKEGRNL